MKKKVGIITSAVATIALCSSLVVGSTFALFTSEDSVSLTVTSAKVDVNVSIKDKTAESVIGADTVLGGFSGEDGLTLSNVVPGEKYSFTVSAENAGTVAALCRTTVEFTDVALASAFEVTVGGVEYGAIKSYATPWSVVEASESLKELTVEITFPYLEESQNEYMGLSTDIIVKVEGVQANAQGDYNAVDPAVEYIPEGAKVVSNQEQLSAAFANAKSGDTVILADDITLNQYVILSKAAADEFTLEGNGHTITLDLSEKSQGLLFGVNNSKPNDYLNFQVDKITVNNLNIEGNAQVALYFNSKTSGATLNNVNISGEYALAAINFNNNGGGTLNNCDITNSIAPEKGVYYKYGFPTMSIFANRDSKNPVTLNNTHVDSLFINNNAAYNGTTKVFVNEGSIVDYAFVENEMDEHESAIAYGTSEHSGEVTVYEKLA